MIASARHSRSCRSGSATEIWCRICSCFIGLLQFPILLEEPKNGETTLLLHLPLHLLHLRLDHQVDRFVGCDCHIEFLFRDSKQFTGLTDCQSRAKAVLDFHFNAALATLNLARAEELRGSPATPAPVFSMASWKQRHFNERLLEVFSATLALDLTWVKNHPGYEKLRTYGAIAA
jgi:hypothetical protein